MEKDLTKKQEKIGKIIEKFKKTVDSEKKQISAKKMFSATIIPMFIIVIIANYLFYYDYIDALNFILLLIISVLFSYATSSFMVSKNIGSALDISMKFNEICMEIFKEISIGENKIKDDDEEKIVLK